MLKRSAQKLASVVVLVTLASLLIFVLSNAMPGDAAVAQTGAEVSSEELVAALRQEFGLDRPLLVRWGSFLADAATGDLGTSFRSGEPVTTVLARHLPVTLSLLVAGFAIALLIAVPAGIAAALRPNSGIDRASTAFSSVGIAIPNFWLALLLVLLFALRLNWLPATGYVPITVDAVEWARHILLPAVVLGTALSAELARQIRSSLAQVLNTNFVRTLRAAGLPERSVILRHALRSALAPVLSVLGIQVAIAIATSIVIEAVFNLNGLGSLMVRSVFSRDAAVLQGVMLLSVLLVAVSGFFVDFLYGLASPKARSA